MKIIQMLPTIAYGDGVGDYVLAVREIVQKMGYKTEIYAENIDSRLPPKTAVPVRELQELSKEDVVIYHGSIGTDLNYQLPRITGRKLMIYHNVTPPEFFEPYNLSATKLSQEGLRGIEHLSGFVEYCIAVSEFNRQNLIQMGYKCPISVCPTPIPFSDYETPPDMRIIRRYGSDGFVNLLFVGRIAPNKKQEDIIRAFYVYHKYYNEKSRLFLIGSWNGMDRYYRRLLDYIQRLGLMENVFFSSHCKFNELLAYYRLADVFVCMSEHEGFCVPLVEAMYFDIPIVAYACTAIPETLGEGGVLLESKDPATVARTIHELVTNAEYRDKVRQGQRERLADYSYQNVSNLFEKQLLDFLKKKGNF